MQTAITNETEKKKTHLYQKVNIFLSFFFIEILIEQFWPKDFAYYNICLVVCGMHLKPTPQTQTKHSALSHKPPLAPHIYRISCL